MLEGANPFEFLVETLSTKPMSFNMGLVDAFSTSKFNAELMTAVEEGENLYKQRKSCPRRVTERLPRWRQVLLLSLRGFRNAARDPTLLLTYNVVTVLVAFLSGCIFYHVKDNIAGVQNRVGTPHPSKYGCFTRLILNPGAM